MKTIAALGAVALLALAACDQIENDPDIQEARTAIKGAIKDEGAALKQVRDEARAARETNSTDETQKGRD